MSVAEGLGVPHVVPQGAFYLWLALGSGIGDTMEFCRRLVSEAKVAVAPGDTFGSNGKGAIRISLAAAEETIEEGMRRIASVVHAVQPS